jgi:hypothetical protein
MYAGLARPSTALKKTAAWLTLDASSRMPVGGPMEAAAEFLPKAQCKRTSTATSSVMRLTAWSVKSRGCSKPSERRGTAPLT